MKYQHFPFTKNHIFIARSEDTIFIFHVLRQKLLHFGLMLLFASKVVTFRVNVTFCGVTSVVTYRKMPVTKMLWTRI